MDITDLRGILPKTAVPSQKRPMSGAKMIVVHHVGDGRVWSDVYDAVKEYINEANYHIKKDWGGGYRGNGIQYHYKVARDGTVYRTRDIEEILWHATNANPQAVGVCLDGDLTLQPPTQAQLKGLQALLDELRNWLKIPQSKVFGHKELVAFGNYTACPGQALHHVIKYRDTGAILDKKELQPFNIHDYIGKVVELPNGEAFVITDDMKKIKSPDIPTLFAYGYTIEGIVKAPGQSALDSIPLAGQLEFPNAPHRKLLESIKKNWKKMEPWINS